MDPDRCRLCGAPRPDPEERCPACGLHPARELPSRARWGVVAGLVGIYALVAVVLALTR